MSVKETNFKPGILSKSTRPYLHEDSRRKYSGPGVSLANNSASVPT